MQPGPLFDCADLTCAACKCNLSVIPYLAVCGVFAYVHVSVLVPKHTNRLEIDTGAPSKSGEMSNTGLSLEGVISIKAFSVQ